MKKASKRFKDLMFFLFLPCSLTHKIVAIDKKLDKMIRRKK